MTADAAPSPRPHQGRRLADAALVATWMACNIGVLLLNKALLSSFGFGYPVFLTALHVRGRAAAARLARCQRQAASRSEGRTQAPVPRALGTPRPPSTRRTRAE